MIQIGLHRVSSRVRRLGAVLAVAAVFASGCGSAGPTAGDTAPAGSDVNFTSPVEVTDAGGTPSTFTAPAQRIACSTRSASTSPPRRAWFR